MNERMQKVYADFGEGFLELCDTVYSISQVFSLKKVCRCESCREHFSEEELKKREDERAEKIKAITFDDILHKFQKEWVWDDMFDEDGNIIEEEDKENDDDCEAHQDDYGNGYESGKCDNGRYLLYYTCNDLTFIITEQEEGGYLFEVSPPGGYFRVNSTLYDVLLKAGYEFVSYWDYKLGKTGLIYRSCAVCGKDISLFNNGYSRFRYCPYCGREFDARYDKEAIR